MGTRPARCSPSSGRRRELVTPRVRGAVEATAGRVLPFGLRWHLFADPRGVGFGIFGGDMGHRVPSAAPAVATRSLRAPPAGARDVRPPVAVIEQYVTRTGSTTTVRDGI